MSNEELMRVYREGGDGAESARGELITRNMGLVYSVANDYPDAIGTLTREDLEQEGFIGLIKAVDVTYDSGRGRFSSHASTIIRHHIVKAIQNQSRNVRLPQRLQEGRQDFSATDLASEVDLATDDTRLEENLDRALATESGRRVTPDGVGPDCFE